jgi:hypothetical protein
MAITDPSEFIEDTVAEMEQQVQDMEDDMNDLVIAYLSTFAVDNKELINFSSNYEHANLSDSVFDEAYKTFVGAFLVYLGKKIVEGTLITVADFSSKGINPIGTEKKLVEKMIGFVDGKVVKGGYLANLGKMSVLRQRFHDYLIKSIASTQKLNKFLKDAKPLFKSTGEKKSAFASYYTKYAYDSIQQATNSIALYIADKRGLNRFLYKGGLVRDSRPFCREHAGQILTRADALVFDGETWKGKIPDVPFLIAAGGYSCQHFISWLPNE